MGKTGGQGEAEGGEGGGGGDADEDAEEGEAREAEVGADGDGPLSTRLSARIPPLHILVQSSRVFPLVVPWLEGDEGGEGGEEGGGGDDAGEGDRVGGPQPGLPQGEDEAQEDGRAQVRAHQPPHPLLHLHNTYPMPISEYQER